MSARTLAVSIRAAPPPGKLTIRIEPDASNDLAELLMALLMETAIGPIGVLRAAESGSVTLAITEEARSAFSAE